MRRFVLLAFHEVGGYSALIHKYMYESEPSPNATLYDEKNKSCGAVPPYAM
jgi:hypothetical protein